jgi:predicted Zn-dependent protease
MDIKRICEFLSRFEGVSHWFLQRFETDSTTVIRLPRTYHLSGAKLESSPNPHPREVITSPGETVEVALYSEFEENGSRWLGDAMSQLTGDTDAALRPVVEGLVKAARSQRNQPFPLAGKDEKYPDVPLADPDIIGLGTAALLEQTQAFNDRIIAATAKHDGVTVSNLEVFIRRFNVQMRSSTGIAIDYPSTRIDVEGCFLARPSEEKVGEHTARLSARRFRDLDPEAIVAEYAAAARSMALAGPAPNWQGPVVLSGEACANYLSLLSNPLGFHTSARVVFEKSARYEMGKPVAGEAALKGEPLCLWSDPLIPHGFRSSRMSQTDGTASRRVCLANNGQYDELIGLRRYYHYLGLLGKGVAASGMTGNTVVGEGKTPAAALAEGDCVVVHAFSDFGVDNASGQFSVEIRLGEVRKAGRAEPFRGGLLVGNWFDALSDIRFSKETMVYNDYHGPSVIRIGSLQVAG